MPDYQTFLQSKAQLGEASGFKTLWEPSFLFDFQASLVDWAIRKGRAALFADCGLGKTPMQLVWAENVVRHTNKPVLILTPLAVGLQTAREAEKFGIDAKVSRDGTVMPNITITNYERLHYFTASDFAGVVCDESSILKNYAGKVRQQITDFMSGHKYRLLCSATPSPNDHIELGTSCEALGVMRRVEMLSMFFVHDSGDTGVWRLRGHARDPFWRFVASWARAVRKPSDMGFDDERFVLPPLNLVQETLPSDPLPGYLFPTEARTLDQQRQERRQTIDARCQKVAELAKGKEPFIAWCSLNVESEMLTEMIPDAIEVTGSQKDDEKEEKLMAFAAGKARVIVTKPEIAGFGMNWQHCNRMSFFPSHSHEQFYQLVHRCWRFGQARQVHVYIVTTEAESAVLHNMKRKERQSSEMFDGIVKNMMQYYKKASVKYTPKEVMEVPAWLQSNA